MKVLIAALAQHSAALTAALAFPSRPVPPGLIDRVEAANRAVQSASEEMVELYVPQTALEGGVAEFDLNGVVAAALEQPIAALEEKMRGAFQEAAQDLTKSIDAAIEKTDAAVAKVDEAIAALPKAEGAAPPPEGESSGASRRQRS